MKKFIFCFALLASMLFIQSNAEAQVGRPVYRHHHHHGVPYGYGYFPWAFWPAWNVWNPYFGYSFYRYYNYQPYYATYGAISYSVKTGRAGFAYGQATAEGAAYNSRSFCAADDCRPVVWVQGGCASVYANKEKQTLGWGYGVNQATARYYGEESCRQSSPEGGCALQAEVCSF